MDYERSLPKNGVIAGVSALTACTLIALHFVFTSYFNHSTAEELQASVLSVKTMDAEGLRTEAVARLRTGRMPIDQAMALIGRGDRPSEVAPSLEEDDIAAVEGWSLAPAEKATLDAVKRSRAVRRCVSTELRLAELRAQKPAPDPAFITGLEAELDGRLKEMEAAGLTVPVDAKGVRRCREQAEPAPLPTLTPTPRPIPGRLFQPGATER